jgi:hypothetical protein
VDRILENWKQMILTLMTGMTMMVAAVIFQDLDYGDRDDYMILVVTGNFYSPPNRPLLKWSNQGM